MNVFTQEFQKLSKDYARLKVESVVIDKKNSELTIGFIGLPEYIDSLDGAAREAVRADAEKTAETFFKVKAAFKKAYADEENIRAKIFDFLNSAYPSVVMSVEPEDVTVCVDRERALINVKIGFDEYMRGFASNVALDGAIARFLEGKFLEAARVEFFTDDRPRETYKIKDPAPAFIKRDMIAVSDVERVYGKTILSYPKPIKSIADEADGVVLCGKIGRFDRRQSKSTGNTYYTFELFDRTGRISAKLFPRRRGGAYDNKFGETSSDGDVRSAGGAKPASKATDAIDGLRDNEEIVVCGSVRRDSYTKDLVFIANDVNRCKIDYDSIKDDERFNDAGEEYLIVKPQPYVKEVQQDFLERPADAFPVALTGKSFVVFDCETTGLDKANDQIIELAAVKIEDGIITQTFSTFVNPGVSLPPVITKLTGITDDDLKDAPKIRDIFHDFYKFIKGSALVAHNIEFDIEFINRAAKLTGFKVDNDIYDTMTIARKNYSIANYKLGTICEYFGINLTDAHRAVNDALATAEVFIKISEKL
ncbi:MAG: ribonuclease H-like domain-containing protein [Clostridiales bacterium]|jgi:DNA polymerase III epsilon subunit family exonuclease|nr:ribonuclease H-like domain-containing protein [Clostridiales bacterium]